MIKIYVVVDSPKWKKKIKNLENEIKNLRKQMSEYIDELELLIKK